MKNFEKPPITSIFGFNEDSPMNNSFARWVNGIIMFFILMAPIISADHQIFIGDVIISKAYSVIALIAVSPIIIVPTLLEKVLASTEFFEWDYKERKKKESFIVSYSAICSGLSVLAGMSIAFFILNIMHRRFYIESLYLLLPTLIFVINLINIPSLYYPMLKDSLQQSPYIEDKPKDWVDKR